MLYITEVRDCERKVEEISGQERKYECRDTTGFRVKRRNSGIKDKERKKRKENTILTCRQSWVVEKMSPFPHNFCHEECI